MPEHAEDDAYVVLEHAEDDAHVVLEQADEALVQQHEKVCS